MPLISIVMPAYNAEKYIEASIQSVKEQTFTNWELIVVDDGSTDATQAKVKKLQAADDRIRYLFQQNRKLGAARNLGIKSVTGEWVAFLDSDDLWMPDKLEKQIAAVRESPADIMFTNGYYLYGDNQQLEPYDSLIGTFSGTNIYRLLFWHNKIAVLSVMLKSSVIARVGLQDESFRAYGCEDWDYWLRCCKSDATFLGLDYRTFMYRVHDTGMSRDVLKMRMSGCYVLFKNFEASLFTGDEVKKAEEWLINEVRFIISALYEKKEIDDVLFFLKLLGNFNRNTIKYRINILLVKLLKQQSRRITEFVLHH